MYEHLVLFDHQCPWCHKQVRDIIEMDVHQRFIFAPLDGTTAKRVVTGAYKWMLKANSVVLIENYESTGRDFSIRSKAVLRIYWLNGNGWGLIGCLSLLPKKLSDFVYRYIAEHRHQFKLKMPRDPGPKERFLP